MQNIVGPPVRDSDFFERTSALEELWNLVGREDVLMLAPRRVGKTSLLCRMYDHPKPDWRTLFFTVESATSEKEFVTRLIGEIHSGAQGATSLVGRFKPAVEAILSKLRGVGIGPVQLELAEALGSDWREAGISAIEALRESGQNTLILIDELPLLVDSLLGDRSPEARKRGADFLHWFRALRIQLKASKGQVRFVLTGSIGLSSIVRSVGLSETINDLSTYRLGPLTRSQADRFLQSLGEGGGMTLSEEIRDRMLGYIDWPIPFHLQLLFRELRDFCRRQEIKELALIHVDTAFESLTSRQEPHLEHWNQRLGRFNRAELALVHALLKAAAKDPQGVSESTSVQIRRKVEPQADEFVVLAELCDEGYLVRDVGRWRFASSLLRIWWRQWVTKTRS